MSKTQNTNLPLGGAVWNRGFHMVGVVLFCCSPERTHRTSSIPTGAHHARGIVSRGRCHIRKQLATSDHPFLVHRFPDTALHLLSHNTFF